LTNVALDGWVTERSRISTPSCTRCRAQRRASGGAGGPAALRRLFDRFRAGSDAVDLRVALRDDVDPAFAALIDVWPVS
jgi:hypothetical protein